MSGIVLAAAAVVPNIINVHVKKNNNNDKKAT